MYSQTDIENGVRRVLESLEFCVKKLDTRLNNGREHVGMRITYGLNKLKEVVGFQGWRNLSWH